MRLLVIGAAGMLGQDLLAAAQAAGHEPVGLDLPEIDITDAAATARGRARRRARTRSSTAPPGPTSTARRSSEELAARVNAEGAGNVAAAAAAAGALAIQISTDYSFDGTATEPYTESSPTNAIGAYGRTKLAGELAVAEAATPDFAIVRTSWLFGPHGKNFVDTILRLGAERDELSVVHDQVGCPTYTGHLATALVEIAERRLDGRPARRRRRAPARGTTSPSPRSRPPASTAPSSRPRPPSTAARRPRPAYSVLVSERDDAPRLPAWQDGLAAHLAASRALA